MPDIKLGSLFAGIGVFPLAASRCGIRPVWASEIEKAPISITKRHFPDMAHLGDITKVDGGKIPPVHVITFGSPCQNLSLIGNRSGLAGAKSSLFYQAFRIIQEMRDATDNLYPAIAVWENVMGAFSTNDRMDFRAVLSAFSDTEVPMPPSGRWGNAGMVRGGTPDVCWRLMAAQYWAGSRRLARRQRIFVVADFGGRRAADILFKPRPMLPLPPACGEGGRVAAEGDRTASFETGRQIPVIHPFQCFRMRGAAKRQEETAFRNSFGLPTDPFPTLLASDVTPFAFWYEGDPEGGCIRFLTETESERLMGLPEGWTKYGADGMEMRFMVETDLKLSGCVSADTLAALRAEGYDYKDGNLVPAGKEETMQEKVANTTPAAPLKLDVSVRVIEPVKNLMGFASVKFNDCFVVENLKIVQGSKGLFLGMPSQPDGKGGYRDMAYPVTKEFREQLNTAVLQAYEAKLEQMAERGSVGRASISDQLKAGKAAAEQAKAERPPKET